MDYPSNSKRPILPSTPEAEEETPRLKVVTGDVIRKKPSMGKRLKGLFLGGDARTVWDYVLDDVLLPAARDMVADAFSQGVERMIFGESRGGGRRLPSRPSAFGGGSPTTITNYRGYSGRTEPSIRRGRAPHDFDDIILATRAEAEDVIDQLGMIIEKYRQCSVRDLYELTGQNFHHTDEKYGWTSMRNARVSRTSAGYMLDLPRVEPLD